MSDYKSMDNKQLLELYRKGDEDAGMELYRRQYMSGYGPGSKR